MEKEIPVSVAFALPKEGFWQDMTVAPGTTALEAVKRSGVLERFPVLDADHLSLGIFAVPIKPDRILEAGDRVEIYRPLLVDPKTVPRKAKRKTAGKKKV